MSTAEQPSSPHHRQRIGDRLYLIGGSRYALRFVSPATRRIRELSLGATARPLADVERDAASARALIATGVCPVELRITARAADKARAAAQHPKRVQRDRTTFRETFSKYLARNHASWSLRHAQQQRATMAQYAAPLMARPVADVTQQEVVAVLRPIWESKPETARRLRSRLGAVMAFAVATGLRADNPADAAVIEQLLPVQRRATRHMPALAYDRAPELLAYCLRKDDADHLALAFTLLTGCRSNEVLGARFDEIDEAASTFTVPPSRSKTGTQHVVPLAPPALAMIRRAAELSEGSSFLFARGGRRLPAGAMLRALRGFDADATPHGLRSTFRDWAGDKTEFSRETMEAALAHSVGNSVERAYRRSTALEKRRALMTAWAAFLSRADNVVPLRAVGA